MHSELPSVSVVIPTFERGDAIAGLVDSIIRHTAARLCEIILVDDGSSLKSWRGVQSVALSTERVIAMRLSRNVGQHAALLAGIRQAVGDILVTMDDDFQNPPNQIVPLVSLIDRDTDLVYGLPKGRSFSISRKLYSYVYRVLMSRIGGVRHVRRFSQFRAFKRDLRDAFGSTEGPSIAIDAMLLWTTERIGFYEVTYEENRNTHSRYRFRSLMRHAIDSVTTYGRRPLQFFGLIGVIGAGLSCIVGIVLICLRIVSGAAVPGFAFLAVFTAFVGSLQLLSLAVIGEYVGRINSRSLGQPGYWVAELVSKTGVDNKRLL